MPDDAPHFDENGRLIAPQYDDVYFSAEDGLAETRHVFLEGNRLAQRFAAMKPGERFTIGETGFGTGLNFLAAWQLFEQHAPVDAQLTFVSVEGFPLDRETMRQALSAWPELNRYGDALLQQWGPMWPGTQRLRFMGGRVRLTLLVGDVVNALRAVDASAQAWFLDGFAPSRNPAMWSDEVFAQVARLSGPEATLATYTAAGFVRRGLQAVGFEIEKQPGFGTKRDMTVGRLLRGRGSPTESSGSAIVIGGSLAGAFAARSLAERGMIVTVLEQQSLIDGELPTLSPRVSVLQPKISDQDDLGGRWLREGYALAYRLLESDEALRERCGWQRCGTFQASTDERTERRLRRFVDQFGPTGLCRWIDAEQTETEVGVRLACGGVVIERAGVLRQAGLCAALLDHPKLHVRDGCQAISLQRDGSTWTAQTDRGDALSANVVIIANALDAQRFEQTSDLQLKPVRGQVTLVRSAGQASRLTGLRRPLFYGGYVLPAIGGVYTVGASFVPGDLDTAWRDSDHAAVCDKLVRVLPDEAERILAIDKPSGWAGLRTTTPTHRCYAEEIEPGLYVSLGHGSHGIASAAASGEAIAEKLMVNAQHQ